MALRPSLVLSLHEAGDAETDHISRRLASLADVTRLNGGIRALTEMLRRSSREPDIILIELDGEPDEIGKDLDVLKDQVSSVTTVYGFGRINDVQFLRHLLAIGFKDYFLLPVQDNMLEEIARIVAIRDVDAPQPVIGLVSLAGGVGTSLVALNFAHFLAERSIAGVALAHPQPDPYTTQFERYDFDASDKAKSATPALIKRNPVYEDDRESGYEKGTRDSAIERYQAEGKIILADIGSHLANYTVMEQCDHFIVVGEPDYRSLFNAKSMNGYLTSHYPFAERHFALTKIGVSGRIEFANADIRSLIDDEPVMLYRYDSEIVASALARPVPLLPQSLLKDRRAFDTLSARCRIALKPEAKERHRRSGLFARIRALLADRKMANG